VELSSQSEVQNHGKGKEIFWKYPFAGFTPWSFPRISTVFSNSWREFPQLKVLKTQSLQTA
jgi:hypothetical protein